MQKGDDDTGVLSTDGNGARLVMSTTWLGSAA